MIPKDPSSGERCSEIDEHWASILDGSASDAIYEHLAECDRCRDARHDLEQKASLVARGGDDFEASDDLVDRLLAALPARSKPDADSTPEVDASRPPTTDAAEKPAKQLPRGWIVASALAIAATGALFFRSPRSEEGGASSRRARVETLSSVQGKSGLVACAPSSGPCTALEKGADAPAGSRVKTDYATQAVLAFSDGTRIKIDRGSELVLAGENAVRAELVRGSFVTEIPKLSSPLVFGLPLGEFGTERGKIAVRAGSERAVLEVASGSARLVDRTGQAIEVRAGEQGRLGEGAPLVLAAPALGEAIAWSERLDPDEREPEAPRGLGELRAQKPGEREERKGAVRLLSHTVRARVAGMMARTEIEEVFENTTGDVLEGIYRFPLPPDATIERLALEVDGKLLDGAFVDRDRAAAIWRGAIVNAAPAARALIKDEIVWVPGPWRDPALLEWQRGGRFELRIFPIPKHGSRRIVLSYTQIVAPSGDTRRYAYPLAHDPSGTTRVGRFELDVEVRGHDARYGVRTAGYELKPEQRGDAAAFRMVREGFVPSGDLQVEYALETRRAELSAFGYRGPDTSVVAGSSASNALGGASSDGYVTLALRPKLPRVAENQRRAFAIVVDSSRSMVGESFTRAKRLTARLVRELDPEDRVSVLACDSECTLAPGGALEPGADAERRVSGFLDRVAPDGASDPTRALTAAYAALSARGERAARVVYVGDGTPTVGPIRPGHIEAAIARALPADRVRVTSVAVGAESDLESLGALSRGGAGVVVPYVPGQSLAEATFSVLAATYGHALSDVEVTLPDGLHAVAPRRLDTIRAGGEALVVARLGQRQIDGEVVLRGKVAGEAFEQRYPLRVATTDSKGNAFVPRVYAALRIADLERDGSAEAKREALELSTAFSVASRYTSLLVLESQAMFRAFGLDNARRAPEWSAEEKAESSVSDGELARADEQPADDLFEMEGAPASGLGTAGGGRFSADAARGATARSAPRSAAASAPTAAPLAQAEPKKSSAREEISGPLAFPEQPRPVPPQRRMIPMRRIWQRVGDATSARLIPKSASPTAIESAERTALSDENRREPTRKLYALYAQSADLDAAERVVTRWIARDPLDTGALTARADLAARRGERALSIRLLGSVLDARPGDVAALRRLERLHRWAGQPELGCRHLIAAAELRQDDARLLADALRCSDAANDGIAREHLLLAASSEVRQRAEALLREPATDDSNLRGDLRVEASWSSDDDLDIALVDPEGQRVSWLGAPTRAVISARDVTAAGREGLALRGATPGEYVIEIVRTNSDRAVSGELTIHVAGTSRKIPFRLSGVRASVAVATIRMEPRLVPL